MPSVDDVGGEAGDRLRQRFASETERRLALGASATVHSREGRQWWAVVAAMMVVLAVVTAAFVFRSSDTKSVAPATSSVAVTDSQSSAPSATPPVAPTTTPTITTPTTTTPTTTGERSSETNLQEAMIFGLQPWMTVDDGKEVALISAILGLQPTFDTGWYDVASNASPGIPDCDAGRYRVVWWNDVRIVFGEARTHILYSWSVGDPDVIPSIDARVEPSRPANPSPSGLTTTDGIEVGMQLTAIAHDKYGPFVPLATGGEIYTFAPPTHIAVASVTNYLAARNGRIVGIGSSVTAC